MKLKPERHPTFPLDERDLAAAVLDHLGDLVLVLDREGRIVRFNKECERVTGLTASQAAGRPLWDLLASPEEADSLRATFANLAPARFPNRQESRLITREGEPRLISWCNTALLDWRGEVGYVLSAGIDITERRWAEEDLLRSNQALRTLIESSPLAISVLDREGLVRVWNPAAERIFGWSRREVVGRAVPFVSEFGPEAVGEHLRRSFEGELLSGVETALRRKEGSLVDVELWTAVLRGPQGQPESLLSMMSDISERKRAQEALRLREEQLRLITDSVPALISYIDAEHRYRFLNRQYEIWFGRPREELYGRTMREVLGDEVYEMIRPYVEAALAGQEVTYETWLPYRSEGARFVHATYVPNRADGKDVKGLFALVSDLTDRKQAEEELRAAKEAVEAASRAKDHFLAVLSHELRTPLTPVLATISALETDESLRRGLRDSLAMIRRNVELEARLIDDLLDLTRIARGKLELHPESVDARQILHHAVNICCAQEVAAGRLRLEMGVSPGDYKLRADGPRLTQVFWNLLNNAVKFTPPGGLITVRSWIEEGPPGHCFVAEVSDTGIGIEPERLSRVFDAFEQTDRWITRRFGGLGLGLAVSKAILEMHGGSLTASSEGLGKGATFTVRLPAGNAVDPDETLMTFSAPRSAERPVPRPDRPLRILLVEDHPDTAEAMADLLRILGYEVDVAGSVGAALSTAEEAWKTGGIDLVVSDLGLPDGSGHDLMRELVRRYGLKGIALSGYGMEEDVRKSLEVGFDRHLTKPVTLQALKAAIQQALGLDAPDGV